METKHHFRDHILSYILIPLIIVVSVLSYYRFIINQDYVIQYEGICDPAMESCFLGCADDECTEEYGYSIVQKYAADLYAQCGSDITDCEAANMCLPDDRECSITYNDTNI